MAWFSYCYKRCGLLYLFAAPQVAVLPTTGSLSAIAPLASSTIQPQDVINSPAFQAILKGTTIQRQVQRGLSQWDVRILL